MTTAADYLVDALTQAGVKRIYGVVGDSLNGISDSLRRSGKIDWIHVRHEEGAAFAAGAEAHLTGHLAVCAGSCGPGNLHPINGLFDCHRSGVPVLAIAAQFRSTTGYSPHAYRLRRRIEHAQMLLRSSTLSVLDVALSCGFGSHAHFTTVFGRMVGESPNSWRTRMLQGK